MTDEQHGWRAVALYSWQADHLKDEETGDPNDEWFDAITDFDMRETNDAENPGRFIQQLIKDMDWKIGNVEAQGSKLLSITISLTRVPIYRPGKKPAHRDVKRR
jgi:hypothetical protein